MTVGIGLAGTGCIGRGVAGILKEKGELIAQRSGMELQLIRATWRSRKPSPDEGLPEQCLTRNLTDLLDDPKITIIVELLGGVESARHFINEAIERGKSIVTANKALLAIHGSDIMERCRKKGVFIAFEGAVAAAIPVISSIRENFVADSFEYAYGILNGTTNYILTGMMNGNSYEDALQSAMQNGFAESNPSLDIEGRDSAQKLAILASVLFNTGIPGDVYTEGIKGITREDLCYAHDLGCVIKLLASARKVNSRLDVRVQPALIPCRHELASVGDENNAVFLKGDNVGPVLLCGSGAGMMPTASIVIGDIVKIARKMAAGRPENPLPCFEKTSFMDPDDMAFHYFLRFAVLDGIGTLAQISRIMADHCISISGAWAKGKKDETISLVMTTYETTQRNVCQAVKEIEGNANLVCGKSLVVPFIDI